MTLMTWSNSYSVGIPSIDAQHQKLVGMINEMYDGMIAKRSRETMAAVFEKLILYTVEHFDYEEKLFAQTHYPESESHKLEHNALKQKVIEMHARFKQSTTGTLSLEVLNFLKAWLTNHVTGTDKKYTQHFTANNIF